GPAARRALARPDDDGTAAPRQARRNSVAVQVGPASRLYLVRPWPSGRSAGLQPAVSRIFNPLAVRSLKACPCLVALPNAIRRYSRLKICATPNTYSCLSTNKAGAAFCHGEPTRPTRPQTTSH